MAVHDDQGQSQSHVFEEQPKDNDENIDPVLLNWALRSARKKSDSGVANVVEVGIVSHSLVLDAIEFIDITSMLLA